MIAQSSETNDKPTGYCVPRLRFAPSPNGHLHLGHALSALVGWQWAKTLGGTFLLRIEDIDTARTREPFVDAIFEDLQWLGLTWPKPVLRQSQRFSAYKMAADKLHQQGLLYTCFATRRELATVVSTDQDPDGTPLYPGLHRNLSASERSNRIAAGEPYALRIDMRRASTAVEQSLNGNPLTYRAMTDDGLIRTIIAKPERWGDAVIIRKDTPASYHLAVVIDDAYQDITHVTRGRDLEAATDLHCLLQHLLGLSTPVYHHHRLLRGDDGNKFSKSDHATSLRSLRQAGKSPDEVYAMIGKIDVPAAVQSGHNNMADEPHRHR